MDWRRKLLIVVLLAATAVPAWAGIFFNRKPKGNPTERVPTLIYALKAEQDEHKRAAAAEELRNYDTGAYPEIVNALVDAAMTDTSAAVRSEAVHSLGKIRPISQRAGWALEQATANDASVRVQVQARSALLTYRMSGYHSAKNGEPPVEGRSLKTFEPPLADVPATAPAPVPAAQPVTPGTTTSNKKKLFGRPAAKPTPPAVDGPELTPPM